MTPARPVRLFGDSAVVIDVATVDAAHATAASVEGSAGLGVEDVIVGYRSVTVVVDPTVIDVAELARTLAVWEPAPPAVGRGHLVEIPVALDGSDLGDVARQVGMTAQEVVTLLTEAELHVAFIGFAPGFAYLVGLHPDLAALPRRSTPRPVVAGGSIGLAGGFLGVYPQASPGGWHLVGRTDMRLFDPSTAPYSALQAGDRVRLRVADLADIGEGTAPLVSRPPLRSDAEHRVAVEDAGFLSVVQDGGRLGVARLGVPRAGAADPYSLRVANRLVGNDEKSAAIEVTARGPGLRFSHSVHAAVVGVTEVDIDGRGVPTDTIVPVLAGQLLTIGALRQGLRAYVAVAGGLETPVLLGSRSSDVLCGLGAGALARGDVLGIGPPGHPRGHARHASTAAGTAALRVMLGPDVFPPGTVESLIATTWEVDPSSNRIGVRLSAARPLDTSGPGTHSKGMITGAIQLPPDGRPIALLCDHATVGGYPVIATVVSADLGVLGQLRPHDAVRLEPVDLSDAARARSRRERQIGDGVVGWYPVRTD